jgi:tRNA pseudouridine38-40 synthase
LRNIRLIVAYEGSLFHGSQFQPDLKTVQGQIEQAIYKLTGENIRISMAGRTDRGVNAQSQTVNFFTRSKIPSEKFALAINTKLDKGVFVVSSDQVKGSFDSKKCAIQRKYIYYLFCGPSMPVLFWNKAGHSRRPLDIKKMRSAARCLVGKHDFYCFSARDKDQTEHVKNISKIEIKGMADDLIKVHVKGSLIRFSISANSFLYKMVRFIVAALIEAGRGRLTNAEIKAMLMRKTKRNLKLVAPCGLYLSNVKYKS